MPLETPALANDKYRATLRSTFIDGVDTTLNVTAIPPNLPTIVVVGWGTDFETEFRIEGTSGTNSSNYALTGVTKIKGFSGNLPENLAVNCLNVELFFNQWGEQIAAVQETAADAVAATQNYAADAGSTDAYAITLDEVVEYVVGQVVKFKANTANTGAATLQVNSLGVIPIKKNHDQVLVDGDIEVGQIVEVIYDGTNFQMQSQLAKTQPAVKSYVSAAISFSTASTSYVDITNATVTVVVDVTSTLRIALMGAIYNNAVSQNNKFQFLKAGVLVGSTDMTIRTQSTASTEDWKEMSFMEVAVAPGTYIYKAQMRVDGNTGTITKSQLAVTIIPD